MQKQSWASMIKEKLFLLDIDGTVALESELFPVQQTFSDSKRKR